MTTLTELTHAGGFIISEANGNRSRDNVTILSGQDLEAGAVLGKKTSGGKYVAYDSNAGTGEQTAIAILIAKCDATAGDTEAAVISGDAEVNGNELVYQTSSPAQDESGAATDLASVGIKVR